MSASRPFRHLCPEADERDAMSDGEFWERVNTSLIGPVWDLDDEGPDLDVQVAVEPCLVCSACGACGYDQEGRALIHANEGDDPA